MPRTKRGSDDKDVFCICSGFYDCAYSSNASTVRDSYNNASGDFPLLKAMEGAVNVHDAEKHISFYANEPDLLFVINDRAIVCWNALLKQQRQWWHNSKSDVNYEMVGEPDFRMPAPGLVMVTYFLTSHRTLPDGQTSDSRFGVSALWQKRAEGWRIIYAHESLVIK